MAKTVDSAFNEFMRDFVNLSPTRVSNARNSRDAMFDRINALKDFLPLDKVHHMQFGSFARKTKIRPIDDIDLIISLKSSDFEIICNGSWDDYKLKLKNTQSEFFDFCDRDYSGYAYIFSTYYLNSTKIKNFLKNRLEKLYDCAKAELHSKGEAVTLKFRSYEWNFDIVPAFYIEATAYSEEYYLIPNKFGGWKKTNPKIDRDRVKDINSECNGKAVELVRLAKYWNRRHTMPSMPSYLIEAIVLNFCKSKNYSIRFIDCNFRDLLSYISQNIFSYIDDPKGIQGNINSISYEQKYAIATRAKNDYTKASSAVSAEIYEKNQEKAIKLWREILGGDFPTYG